ncbi:MAG: hypothetical protein D6769_02115 [Methanobacteriota archaeon]|nr:MAG: hypothetical protein D6769_02115 [Euryarchaeota archaeon]
MEEEIAVSAPGKIILLGSYAVLEGFPALSLGVVDKEGRGVVAKCSEGDGRIVSKEFSIDGRAEDVKGIVGTAYIVAREYLKKIGRWESCNIAVDNSRIFGNKDEKSGLGSSAAATVATIASLFSWNGINIEEERSIINKLSHISHAIESGKVGSGTDIATSCYGTILYTRYSKEVLDNVSIRNSAEFAKKEFSGMEIKRVEIPYNIEMFNIRGRKTATISSVKAFNKAKEREGYVVEKLLKEQSMAEMSLIKNIKEEKAVRDAMHKARESQRRLSSIMESALPGIDPIEPEELTSLIEKVEELPGIVAGRCPGSGGYDGVVFLTQGEGFSPKDIIAIGKELSLELAYLELRKSQEGVRVL